MRMRGWFYSIGLNKCGRNFQVAHNAILNTLECISVGDNVYIAMNNILLAGGKIIIGNNVMIGPGCIISSGNHTYFQGSYRYGPSRNELVVIGNGSWLASHCVALAGLHFPEKSVAAANSVLTKRLIDCGPGIYGGIPAQLIKTTFLK